MTTPRIHHSQKMPLPDEGEDSSSMGRASGGGGLATNLSHMHGDTFSAYKGATQSVPRTLKEMTCVTHTEAHQQRLCNDPVSHAQRQEAQLSASQEKAANLKTSKQNNASRAQKQHILDKATGNGELVDDRLAKHACKADADYKHERA